MAYGQIETQFANQYTMLMAHPTIAGARVTVTLQATASSEADGDQMVQDLVNLAAVAEWTVYQGKKVIPAYETLTPDV